MLFRAKKPNKDKLLCYGFSEEADGWHYAADIANGTFRMTVTVHTGGAVRTQVIDKETGDEYILHRTAGAVGAFVGMVKAEYEATLTDIAEKCFDPDVFKSEQAKSLIDHVRHVYGDELEFLWKKFPDNAVWRRKDTGKWYGALLTVSGRKLGLETDDRLEIIDLRMEPEELARIIDHQNYFPGYHMNKKHWLTICLDGSVPTEELQARIASSYRLAVK